MPQKGHVRGRAWLKRPGRWLMLGLVPMSAGMGVATLLVPGFVVMGSFAEQLLVLLVVTTGFDALVTPVAATTGKMFALVTRRIVNPVVDEDFDDSGWVFARHMFFAITGVIIRRLIFVATCSVGLRLSVWVFASLGLPVQLAGLWPTVVAALILLVIGYAAEHLLRMSTRRGRAQGAVLALAQYGLCLGGLWLSVTLLGEVRLEPGPTWLYLLTLGGLAGLFNYTVGWILLTLPVPGAGSAILIAGNALRLWLVSWLSAWTELPLEINGGGTFLLAVLLITVTMAPARVADRRARRRREPPPSPLDDLLWQQHNMIPPPPFY